MATQSEKIFEEQNKILAFGLATLYPFKH